jgi:ABC-type branched-subunit amino acid transport system substrate-binding protein
MLGASGWHFSMVLADGKQYVNNAVFASNFPLDTRDSTWDAFATAFRRRFQTDPDRVAAPLGYDAATLIIKGIEAAGSDVKPATIAKYLKSISHFKGIGGEVTFDAVEGVNTQTSIIKIKDRTFVRIE